MVMKISNNAKIKKGYKIQDEEEDEDLGIYKPEAPTDTFQAPVDTSKVRPEAREPEAPAKEDYYETPEGLWGEFRETEVAPGDQGYVEPTYEDPTTGFYDTKAQMIEELMGMGDINQAEMIGRERELAERGLTGNLADLAAQIGGSGFGQSGLGVQMATDIESEAAARFAARQTELENLARQEKMERAAGILGIEGDISGLDTAAAKQAYIYHQMGLTPEGEPLPVAEGAGGPDEQPVHTEAGAIHAAKKATSEEELAKELGIPQSAIQIKIPTPQLPLPGANDTFLGSFQTTFGTFVYYKASDGSIYKMKSTTAI